MTNVITKILEEEKERWEEDVEFCLKHKCKTCPDRGHRSTCAGLDVFPKEKRTPDWKNMRR